MRVGLIQCGNINSLLVTDHGDYPEMVSALLGPEVDLVAFDVQTGQVPDPGECDGWVISGSVDSTYDDLPWIDPTEHFLRDVVSRQVPVVGVCFGHQLLAQALGGRVEKADAGWGIGVHEYRLADELPDSVDLAPGTRLKLIASHQDQVVELPAGAEVVASSDHCPVAAFTIGPRVLAIQPHPEFSVGFAHHLVEARRHLFGDELADQALADLKALEESHPGDSDAALDRERVATWMRNVLSAD